MVLITIVIEANPNQQTSGAPHCSECDPRFPVISCWMKPKNRRFLECLTASFNLWCYPLVNIHSYWTWPIEIVYLNLPNLKMDVFHSCLYVYQRVSWKRSRLFRHWLSMAEPMIPTMDFPKTHRTHPIWIQHISWTPERYLAMAISELTGYFYGD